MKKIQIIFFVIISLSIFNNVELPACTNLLITKGASADGSTMITFSADSYNFYGELYHFPAVKYHEGAMLDIYEWDTGKFLGRIKQARETYNVVGNMNEYQLSIGETTYGGLGELRNTKGIIDYGSLIYIALQRAKTAREAIKIMTDLVAEYGYYSEGESFSIADPNEVWIMELIGKGEGNKGALWVAVRIPDGYISAHANQARITTFPLNDPNNCLYAPDVISFAREKGYFNGKDSEFSFSDVYAPLDFGAIRFCEARVWSIFRRVNSSMEKYISYIKCENLERMPLYIKPDKKISVHDAMRLMRDHYEGTELDMTKGMAAGPYSMPYRWRPLTYEFEGQKYFNERPISTPQTGFSFIAQSRSWLPNEIGGVFWFGVDDTYMTVYMPMYASITKTPYNFSKGLGSLGQFTWESGFWVFNFVSNFAYPRYSLMVNDIITVQNELEGKFIARQETIEKTALALYKNSRGEAIDYLTKYSSDAADLTFKRWKKLGEDLILKYMDGIVKDEYFKPKNVGYPDAFKKLIVQESGEKLKVKKLPGEDQATYQENIHKADKLLKEKKYFEAKNLYQKATELMPDESYPKNQLEKIKKMLADIDSLHETHFSDK
ncbi:MAG: C69 family dipeptidase [Bacteroidota bacterium]|nr:C69 family dipeptidase [Bacteroidota bacterium]